MLKKLRSNLKNLNNRAESSMLDFVLEMSKICKIERANFESLKDQRKFTREKGRGLIKMADKVFNDHDLTGISLNRRKKFLEDKENEKPKIMMNQKKISDGEKNMSIRNFFQTKEIVSCIPSSAKIFNSCPKAKKIEFYDEYNKKNVKMIQFEEKDIKFTKSKILPPVKWMKIDNDVMTDEEQLGDALKMMRDNLKDTIKLIQTEKDYLNKNLSRKIKFTNVKNR
jgi:hypothetical protein